MKKRHKKALISTLILAFLPLFTSNVLSQTFYLNKFLPVKNVTLRSLKDSYEISFPIPERWNVDSATFTFPYVNSSALLAYKSRLTVLLDEIPLKQVTLDPISNEGIVSVDIPGELLDPGYHQLTIMVAQHVEKECEDPFAPELWTFVKLEESKLSINYSLKSIPLKLSSIPTFIEDPKIIPMKKINFILTRLNDSILNIASIVAGGLGARMDYKPILISISQKYKEGMDNIFIGPKSELQKLKLNNKIESYNSLISIEHVPYKSEDEHGQNVTKIDNTHVIIIITGNNEKEVKKAATAFSSLSFSFPRTKSMIVHETSIPALRPYDKKSFLSPGNPVFFNALGFSTHTFRGMNKKELKLEFYLPSDLYIKPNEYATMLLHFAYSASLRKDSNLKIMLNGKDVSSIHLDNENGAMFENYKISIPTYLFKPGKNTITFIPYLIPQVIKRCEGFQDMNIFLTMFDDSIIRFPKMSHWGKMPAIEYFFDTGFPFSRVATGSEACIFLTKIDIPRSTLALNLVAFLGQKTGIAPLKIHISSNLNLLKEKETIFLGSIDEIPQKFMEKAPLKLLKPVITVKYPQFDNLSGKRDRSWCQKLEERLRGFATLFPIKPYKEKSIVKEKLGTLDQETGLLMEFESPITKGKSILLWTAKDSSAFLNMSRLLWIGKIRSSSKGDLVLFPLNDIGKVESHLLGPEYYTGNLTKFDEFDFYLRSYPWLLVTLLITSVTVIAVILAIYLRRRKKKRLSGED